MGQILDKNCRNSKCKKVCPTEIYYEHLTKYIILNKF